MKWIGLLIVFSLLIWIERRKRTTGTESATEETEVSRASERTPTLEYYTDKKGEYRWRLKAGNGKIIANSGEGYKTKAGVEKAAGTVEQAFSCYEGHWKRDD